MEYHVEELKKKDINSHSYVSFSLAFYKFKVFKKICLADIFSPQLQFGLCMSYANMDVLVYNELLNC